MAVNPGARATFTFTGPTAKWIAFRDQWAGIAKVYVDGVFKQEVDTYASPQMAQAVMFTVTGLGPGAHTLDRRSCGTTESSVAWETGSGLTLSTSRPLQTVAEVALVEAVRGETGGGTIGSYAWSKRTRWSFIQAMVDSAANLL